MDRLQTARIRDIMILKGITQREIARKTGYSEAAISAIIRGKRRSRRIEGSIAYVLRYPRKVLFERLGDRE